jgi:hypothetical protein
MEAVIKVLNYLVNVGLIEDYAIAGAVGALFYAEPIDTSDLDVLVILPTTDSILISLSPIYEALRKRGCREEDEFIIIHGVPVQFLPAYDLLTEEAIQTSLQHECGGEITYVADPEHLIAIAINTGRRKDYLKIEILLEQASLDLGYLKALLIQFRLLNKFIKRFPDVLVA